MDAEERRYWTARRAREERAEIEAQARLEAAPAVETDYLRVPVAILRDFLARAEADLANPAGLTQTWPAFADDVRRAVERARTALGAGE
jgi:hypothetical protein